VYKVISVFNKSQQDCVLTNKICSKVEWIWASCVDEQVSEEEFWTCGCLAVHNAGWALHTVWQGNCIYC